MSTACSIYADKSIKLFEVSMKKKILCLAVLMLCLFGLTACNNTKIDLNNYLIEERNNLFTAEDDNYAVTFSTGLREKEYDLDGVRNEMVDFGVLTIARIDRQPIATTGCEYVLTIDDEVLRGNLIKSELDNTYSCDLERSVLNESKIHVQINITGYTFEKDLENTSNDFSVDKTAAISVANSELNESLNGFSKDKNNFEAVMKIVKDYSTSEVKNYYWYIGVVAQNGETLGILIDATNGDVIAKKI